MIPLGIGDFFSTLMEPLRTAVGFVLGYAYQFLVLIGLPADAGVTWLLSIMMLTIVVRSLLIPLFVKQINSARNMQAIQPQMKALQEKYGADREKLGQETQKLMKEEGVNPMASCLPLVLQMPIFFALYQVLYAASQNNPRGWYLENHVDMVESLYRATLFGDGGVRLAGNFGEGGNFFAVLDWSPTRWFALVLILMMTALFFITQKQLMSKNMTPEAMTGAMAQQQKLMLYLFPLMYLFMGVFIQIGVLLYWVTSNLWTLGQQWLLIRNNPTPGTPAYIDWEERMIARGKDPVAIAAERKRKRSRRPAQAQTSASPSGVQRQTVQPVRPTTANPATPGEAGVARQQIQRQQRGKASRAQRKTK